MKNYFISPVAEQDLDEIVTFLAQESTKAAMKLLDSFYDTMGMLASNPSIGHTRTDLTKQPVRFWPFKWHYLIVYRDCSPIEIIRVLSGYRDISNLLS